MKTMRAWAAALLIFLSGIVIGGVGGMMIMGHLVRATVHGGPERMEKHVMRRLTHKLDLNPEQREDVANVVRDVIAQAHAPHDEVQPQFQEMLATAVTNLHEHLTPEQRQTLDAMHAKWQNRH